MVEIGTPVLVLNPRGDFIVVNVTAPTGATPDFEEARKLAYLRVYGVPSEGRTYDLSKPENQPTYEAICGVTRELRTASIDVSQVKPIDVRL